MQIDTSKIQSQSAETSVISQSIETSVTSESVEIFVINLENIKKFNIFDLELFWNNINSFTILDLFCIAIELLCI